MLWATFQSTFPKQMELPRVAHVATPLLSNGLRNIMSESVPLVAVLVPPSSSMAAVSRKTDSSDEEVGDRHQSHTLRFGKCL